MVSPIVLTDPDELPNGYCQMIALAWFIHDYALTFDDEVRYIWCRRVRWSAALFLLTRYLAGLMLVLSALSCTVRGFTDFVLTSLRAESLHNDPVSQDLFDWFEGIGTFVLFFFVQVILQSRLYIMYNRSRRILISNGCLMVVEAIVAGIITAFYYGIAIPVIVPPWTLGSCFNERPREFAAVWGAPLAFESYLAVLAVRKIIKEHSLLLNTTSLMALMVRDNIVYFLMIVLAMTVNLFLFAFKTGLNPGVSVITIVHAAGAIGGTRIVLSLLRSADNNLHLSRPSTMPSRATGPRIAFRRAPATVELQSVHAFDGTAETTLNDPPPPPLSRRPSASNFLGSVSRGLVE